MSGRPSRETVEKVRSFKDPSIPIKFRHKYASAKDGDATVKQLQIKQGTSEQLYDMRVRPEQGVAFQSSVDFSNDYDPEYVQRYGGDRVLVRYPGWRSERRLAPTFIGCLTKRGGECWLSSYVSLLVRRDL